jgi:hypothetical protein
MNKIAAISLLFVFTALQYGKMVSWIYCELRVEISDSGKSSCDCEKILTDKPVDSKNAPLSHSHNHKEKLNEPFNDFNAPQLSFQEIINTSPISNYSADVQSGFSVPPYHPPAHIS